MDSNTTPTNLLTELSSNLAAAVEVAQTSIVHIAARRRHGASGLIWRPDGYIVTADHIIEREEEIVVGLPDGSELAASIVGRDPGTDIAVLKVDASALTVLRPAETDAKVGHLVLALGSLHTGSTMASLGVVSAMSAAWRSWRGGNIEGVIRSDVTLYPGFSGGPLIDPVGGVIGLNTSALARGLAVTLPWNFVARVADTLASQGRLSRGYLGITTQPVALPEALRQSAGITQESGLLVAGVEPGSPAENAGLLLGDILVTFADRATTDMAALQEALGPGSAGQPQPVQLLRAGQLTDMTITVGER